jgi:two-component system, response regulator PdtaR
MPKNILVIDDDIAHTQNLSNELQQRGYTVNTVSSLVPFSHPLQIDHADIVLLNCLIEDINPISNQLQQEQKPFLFLGSEICDDFIAKIAEHGALGFLLKPMDAEQCVIEIEIALHWHWEKLKLNQRRENIDHTIENNRKISVALGILMDRYQIKATDAFSLLRNVARNKQRRIVDFATSIILNLETSLPSTTQTLTAIQKELEEMLD